ncbi:unnamed protein product [Heligmosomoides polygyrus]|uniref:7TM_GPCR_Srx domain-containing protein n=1 Tax=Heligmosomoides polygyrus TaxID=6339 RepID=A0A183GIR0_HELPZ|nr:unnamed protein product [Heligmosomoides polygyrus]
MASKRKSDINFLTQAVAQGVVFATELFTYFFVAWYIENKFVFFCFTTLAWSVVHTSDGPKYTLVRYSDTGVHSDVMARDARRKPSPSLRLT